MNEMGRWSVCVALLVLLAPGCGGPADEVNKAVSASSSQGGASSGQEDANADGKQTALVSPPALQKAAEAKTTATAPRAEQRAGAYDRLRKRADKDGDGRVTYGELSEVIPSLTEEGFKRFDTNGDGVFSAEDGVSEDLRSALAYWTKGLLEADGDNDGKVTFEEAQAKFEEITPEQFAYLDRNKDAALTQADRWDRRARMQRHPRQILVERLLQWDSDGDGKLAFEEAVAASPDYPRASFDRLDENGDGFVSLDDLTVLPGGMATPGMDRQAQLIQRLLDFDSTGDGKVTFEELQSQMPSIRREVFDRADRNNDGILDEADKPKALGRPGIPGRGPVRWAPNWRGGGGPKIRRPGSQRRLGPPRVQGPPRGQQLPGKQGP